MNKSSELQHFYSNHVYDKKIVILGPCPPPLGGISVHIKRVTHKLLQQGNQVKLFDSTQECRRRFLNYFGSLFMCVYRTRPDHLYYHTLFLRSYWLEFAFLVLLKKIFRFRLVVIEHNYRYLFLRSRWFKKVLNVLMRAVDKQVLIGDAVHNAYLEHKMYLGKDVSVESPFLPPEASEKQDIVKHYPDKLDVFLSGHSPLIVANASQVILFDGVDLYGFDMCIELVQNLKRDYPNVGLIFALPTIGDEKYFAKVQNCIKQYGLENNWYFLIQEYELWPLFKKVDLLVRPNAIDTFGISVQEALSAGTPAVATDVCRRPAGTILCKKRNQKDFEDKVRQVLTDRACVCAIDSDCSKVSCQNKLRRQ